MVTLRNLVGDAESNSFGGVIFARADNNLVQTVQDVENRIVIASSIYDMGSGPMQWEQMRAFGEDLLFAPSQAHFCNQNLHTIANLSKFMYIS